MSVGAIDLSGFQNNEAVANEFDRASSEDRVQNKMVAVSGTYVMGVSTLCFRNKKKNGDLIISPTLAPSSKGGLNLVASLEVLDGTPQVAKGDYLTVNIPVWPGPKASQEDVSKMFNLSKPRMCALLGVDSFKLDLDTLVEKFTTEWDEDDNGKFTLKKDHALKGKVVCVFDDGVYNNRPTLNLVNMRRFNEGDVSVSNGGSSEPQSGFGSSSAPATGAVDEKSELDFNAAGDAAASGQAAPPPAQQEVAPNAVQEDDLPF